MAVVEISLAGKVAVVTGSSRGVGRAIALRLAEAGCRGVTINYVQNRERGLEVVRELEEGSRRPAGQRMWGRRMPAGSSRDLRSFWPDRYLVNNAGICPGAPSSTPLEDFDTA